MRGKKKRLPRLLASVLLLKAVIGTLRALRDRKACVCCAEVCPVGALSKKV